MSDSDRIWIPDASALNDFRKCPEYFRLRHAEGWEPIKESPYLREGRAAHDALAVWRETRDEKAALEKLHIAWIGSRLTGEEESDAYLDSSLGHLEAVLLMYFKIRADVGTTFPTVRNEAYMEVPIVADRAVGVRRPHAGEEADFTWCGVVDYVLDLGVPPAGNYPVVDTKFTGMYLTSTYFARFDLALQMHGYVAAAVAEGLPCHSFFVDAVHLDRRYRKVQPKDFQFYGPVSVSPEQLYRWAKGVKQTLGYLKLLQDGGEASWPQHDQGCTMWNTICPFHGVCTLPTGVQWDELENNFNRNFWNPKERR